MRSQSHTRQFGGLTVVLKNQWCQGTDRTRRTTNAGSPCRSVLETRISLWCVIHLWSDTGPVWSFSITVQICREGNAGSQTESFQGTDETRTAAKTHWTELAIHQWSVPILSRNIACCNYNFLCKGHRLTEENRIGDTKREIPESCNASTRKTRYTFSCLWITVLVSYSHMLHGYNSNSARANLSSSPHWHPPAWKLAELKSLFRKRCHWSMRSYNRWNGANGCHYKLPGRNSSLQNLGRDRASLCL